MVTAQSRSGRASEATVADRALAVQGQIHEIASQGPGEGLEAFIEAGAHEGRAVLRPLGVAAPRLGFVLEHTRHAHPKPDEAVRDVLTMPELPQMAAKAFEKPGPGIQLRDMAMTICHDLHGVTEGALAEVCVFELDAGSETRSKGVRESLRRGRLYLGNLGAWPWWGKTHWLHVPPSGKWPKRWWLNDGVLLVLAQWRTGLMTRSFHQALREAGVTEAPYPGAYEPDW